MRLCASVSCRSWIQIDVKLTAALKGSAIRHRSCWLGEPESGLHDPDGEGESVPDMAPRSRNQSGDRYKSLEGSRPDDARAESIGVEARH